MDKEELYKNILEKEEPFWEKVFVTVGDQTYEYQILLFPLTQVKAVGKLGKGKWNLMFPEDFMDKTKDETVKQTYGTLYWCAISQMTATIFDPEHLKKLTRIGLLKN